MSPTPLPAEPSATPRGLSMSQQLAANWWLIALRGGCAILFGVLTFVLPGLTLATLVILFASYMLVDGVFGIVAGVRAAQKGERWAWLVVEGIASILTGVIAIAWPAITILVTAYLIAVWSVVSGIFLIVAAFQLTLDHGRWWLVLAGAVSVAFGLLLAFAPIAGAIVLTLYLGGYALAFGVMLLILAFRLRARHAPGRIA